VVLVGTATQLTGAIAIADEVRRDSKRAVERLRELGVKRVVMLTGDNEGTARAIAEQTGVDEYRAELLPEEKVEAVRALQAEYGDVAMVGDGSTTRRRWPRQRSASRWAPRERTRPWRPRTSH